MSLAKSMIGRKLVLSEELLLSDPMTKMQHTNIVQHFSIKSHILRVFNQFYTVLDSPTIKNIEYNHKTMYCYWERVMVITSENVLKRLKWENVQIFATFYKIIKPSKSKFKLFSISIPCDSDVAMLFSKPYTLFIEVCAVTQARKSLI